MSCNTLLIHELSLSLCVLFISTDYNRENPFYVHFTYENYSHRWYHANSECSAVAIAIWISKPLHGSKLECNTNNRTKKGETKNNLNISCHRRSNGMENKSVSINTSTNTFCINFHKANWAVTEWVKNILIKFTMFLFFFVATGCC